MTGYSRSMGWSDLPPEIQECLRYKRKYVKTIEQVSRIEVTLDREGERGTASFLWDPIQEKYQNVCTTGF
jgi:hypothetical protein